LITELLGPQGFALFSQDDLFTIDNVLGARNLRQDERVRDMFSASCAELAVWSQSSTGSLQLPLHVHERLLTTVEYKCNTFSLSICQPHISDADKRSEFLFFFVSDYWKLRKILGGSDVLASLLKDPISVRHAISASQWDFAPKDENGAARDLTVMLWSAKAQILAGEGGGEGRRRLMEYMAASDLKPRIPGLRVIEPETASGD
jgi:hypothetical protein